MIHRIARRAISFDGSMALISCGVVSHTDAGGERMWSPQQGLKNHPSMNAEIQLSFILTLMFLSLDVTIRPK